MNLRFNKMHVRQDRIPEVSSAKRLALAVLVQDASMRGAVVNVECVLLVCTRQSTGHGQ